jgi:uncharacterized protein RhaS with RHS repeats
MYMQARYYDPVIGRFYSNDPLGFRDIHSFNRYTYANNNPYKYTDPDGRIAFLIPAIPWLLGFTTATTVTVSTPLVLSATAAAVVLSMPGDSNTSESTIFVDTDGNGMIGPDGGSTAGSPDGGFIQVLDPDGNPTNTRKDGPHNPNKHPDPRAQNPHGHILGVTNEDGTPWLPVKPKKEPEPEQQDPPEQDESNNG